MAGFPTKSNNSVTHYVTLFSSNGCGRRAAPNCTSLKKVFPIAKRIIGPILLILFGSAAEQRLFSTAELLDRRFGPNLSKKIKSRLLLLRAAPNLTMVPTCQPYRLNKISRGEYTLDLLPPKVLRFAAEGGRTQQSMIKAVKILAVE
ncbi:hypothetical protein [Bradyrhizobium elkanii]|uniref:hypothetical protein n=1 Tax=Bradyrhizobium elkanii TaxID=29448 RepID=UPI002226850B|nr:hypothetical protein [Bradyrhizobium elkanii]MCW2130716.1 hypothetical protein [Bradyrhizobium elkanii]MCW2175872.1 hypothetical protein [Bradyrhizobium elkanii]